MVASGCYATCLVVDDEPLIRWSLARFLEARGFRARSVGSEGLALALLRALRDLTRLDLVPFPGPAEVIDVEQAIQHALAQLGPNGAHPGESPPV